MKTITLIIPVFNEAAGLATHFTDIQAVIAELTTPALAIKVLLIDDGSTDATAEVLAALQQQYPHVTYLCLTRNFGKEAAIHAGLDHCQGDAVIIMDGDLQHPPSLLPEMVALWQQGIQVVEAYKVSRGQESLLARTLAESFYLLFMRLSSMDLRNHTDFKLLDASVVAAYRAMPERKRFFRGMIQWMGFRSAQLPFKVPARQVGKSAWSKLALFKMSIHAITAFSSIPLHLITWLGLFTFLFSCVIGSIALLHKFSGVAVDGFTTVILVTLIIGSVLMIALGIIGLYLGHIYDEIKQRPSYLIDWQQSPRTGQDKKG